MLNTQIANIKIEDASNNTEMMNEFFLDEFMIKFEEEITVKTYKIGFRTFEFTPSILATVKVSDTLQTLHDTLAKSFKNDRIRYPSDYL